MSQARLPTPRDMFADTRTFNPTSFATFMENRQARKAKASHHADSQPIPQASSPAGTQNQARDLQDKPRSSSWGPQTIDSPSRTAAPGIPQPLRSADDIAREGLQASGPKANMKKSRYKRPIRTPTDDNHHEKRAKVSSNSHRQRTAGLALTPTGVYHIQKSREPDTGVGGSGRRSIPNSRPTSRAATPGPVQPTSADNTETPTRPDNGNGHTHGQYLTQPSTAPRNIDSGPALTEPSTPRRGPIRGNDKGGFEQFIIASTGGTRRGPSARPPTLARSQPQAAPEPETPRTTSSRANTVHAEGLANDGIRRWPSTKLLTRSPQLSSPRTESQRSWPSSTVRWQGSKTSRPLSVGADRHMGRPTPNASISQDGTESHDKPPDDQGTRDLPARRPEEVCVTSSMPDEARNSHACYHCRRALYFGPRYRCRQCSIELCRGCNMNAALVHPGHTLLAVTTDTGEGESDNNAEEDPERDRSRCYHCHQDLLTEKYECEDCSDILYSCSFCRRYHDAKHVFQLMPTRGAASDDDSADDNERPSNEDDLAEDADAGLEEPVGDADDADDAGDDSDTRDIQDVGDNLSDSNEGKERLGGHRCAARPRLLADRRIGHTRSIARKPSSVVSTGSTITFSKDSFMQFIMDTAKKVAEEAFNAHNRKRGENSVMDLLDFDIEPDQDSQPPSPRVKRTRTCANGRRLWLPKDQRQLALLKKRDWSNERIAAKMNRTVGAVTQQWRKQNLG